MEIALASSGLITGLTIALSQILKPFLPKKFVTLLPLVLGVGLALALEGLAVNIGIQGLILGLAAMGLYDQKKLVTK